MARPKVNGYGIHLPKENKVLVFKNKQERDRALNAWDNKKLPDIAVVKPGDQVPSGTKMITPSSPRTGSPFLHWLIDKAFGKGKA